MCWAAADHAGRWSQGENFGQDSNRGRRAISPSGGISWFGATRACTSCLPTQSFPSYLSGCRWHQQGQVHQAKKQKLQARPQIQKTGIRLHCDSLHSPPSHAPGVTMGVNRLGCPHTAPTSPKGTASLPFLNQGHRVPGARSCGRRPAVNLLCGFSCSSLGLSPPPPDPTMTRWTAPASPT